MSKDGRSWYTLAATAYLLAIPLPALAQAVDDLPFDRESEAHLRCWYDQPSADDPLATRYVIADDFVLRGHWRGVSNVRDSALFFTLQEPEEATEACRKTLAARGLRASGHNTAIATDLGYNYQVWYDGEIASRRGKTLDRMVSFGDSLSDTGNIYHESFWTFPNHEGWYLGRFSDGRVWTEYLAARSGLPLNTWAIGGAQTDTAFGVIPSLEEQVSSFLGYVRQQLNRYDPERTLFTVWIGANDLANGGRTFHDILRDEERALRKLIDAGARRVILVSLPDISRTPAFRDRADEGAAAGKEARRYNEGLVTLASLLAEESGAELIVVDAWSRFNEILDEPERFGLVETQRPCLDLGSGFGSIDYLKPQRLRADCDRSRTMFWDFLHPTTRMHSLVAEWVAASTPRAWDLR